MLSTLVDDHSSKDQYVYEVKSPTGWFLMMQNASSACVPHAGYECSTESVHVVVERGEALGWPWPWKNRLVQGLVLAAALIAGILFCCERMYAARQKWLANQERVKREWEIAQAEEKARKQEERKRRSKEDQEWNERIRKRRLDEEIAALVTRYELLPHLEDPTYLANYARKHEADLIKDREKILKARAAHHSDKNFIAQLKKERSDIYRRSTWQERALALAEVANVSSPPRTPPRIDHLDQFPHHADPAFIEEHTRVNARRLLAERDKIIAEYHALHDYPELQKEQPERYQRSLFRVRALALAEQLAVEPKPEPEKRPHITPEEWRERYLRRKREKVMDFIAAKRLLASARGYARDTFAELDLPEDEREDLVTELLDSLRGFDEHDDEEEIRS